MADSVYKTRLDFNDLAQDDPFAELTRIMGHDPRTSVPVRPVTQEPADDLALDLENELMGSLSEEESEDVHAQQRIENEVASWQQAFEPVEAPQAETDFESSLDAMLEDAFAQEGEPAYDAPQPELPNAEALQEEAFVIREEDLAAWDSDFADADFAGAEFTGEEEPHLEASPQNEPAPQDYAAASHEEAGETAEPEITFDYTKALAGRADLLKSYQPEDESEQASIAETSEPTWVSAAVWENTERQEWFPQSSAPQEDSQEQWWQSSAEETDVQPATEETFAESYGDDNPPEVDTVEVPEGAVAVADQLDIPEVSYREEVKPATELDEIEEILAGAFGETADPADQPADAWGEAPPPPAEEEERQRALEDEFLLAGMGAGAAYVAGQQPVAAYADEWSRSDDDPALLTPTPGVQPPAHAGSSRLNSRLLMAAAVVGGVVILGGLGVFALSFGDNGEPVLVAADDSPIKVRPENPGGVQIPNQENQVYKRVSGEEAETPAQPRLISATEEPASLPEPIQETFTPEETSTADAGSTAEAGKDERTVALAPLPEDVSGAEEQSLERLTSTASEETARDAVTVTPRRVRTMVVRPDGTMVPHEAPRATPAAASAEPEEPAPSASPGVAENTPQLEPLEPETAAVPRTGPIPPSRPNNVATAQQPAAPARVSQPQPVRSEQPTQVAAVENPPVQAAAASSEWSVQIASQPTAEGAQQSYQQLAQRFGSMLQGKGVNIVKADIEGKGTYYRVRIPSSSKEDAIELCSQLKSAGGSCFVSK